MDGDVAMSAVCETQLMEQLVAKQREIIRVTREKSPGWTGVLARLEHDQHKITSAMKELRKARVSE